jgi:hypothetical protein
MVAGVPRREPVIGLTTRCAARSAVRRLRRGVDPMRPTRADHESGRQEPAEAIPEERTRTVVLDAQAASPRRR